MKKIVDGKECKVACDACIRGHRASTCSHDDRILFEVRRPGRPLSSCPHPVGRCNGLCNCQRVVVSYGIPKASYPCPSNRLQPVGPSAGNGNRVAKQRTRKTTINAAVVVEQIKALENDTDSSSVVTNTPLDTNSPASASSSVSSTPHLGPQTVSGSGYYNPSLPPNELSLSAMETPKPVQMKKSCCSGNSQPIQAQVQTYVQAKNTCCSANSQPTQAQASVQMKNSCCSGNSESTQVPMSAQMYEQPRQPAYEQFPHHPTHLQGQSSGSMYQGFNYNMLDNTATAPPYGFNTPIYNHIAPDYQQTAHIPMAPTTNPQNPVHNANMDLSCQCGNACNCFGCPTHPNNATMIDYARQMGNFMMTGGCGAGGPPAYGLPSQSQDMGFGGDLSQTMGLFPQSSNFAPLDDKMAFQVNPNTTTNSHHNQAYASGSWQQPSTEPSLQPDYTGHQFFDATDSTQKLLLPVKTEEAAPIFPQDTTGSPDSDDTTIISPSAFTWQNFEMPLCSDSNGACMCGPGCKCVGCLTHDPNGVHQDNPYTPLFSEEDTWENTRPSGHFTPTTNDDLLTMEDAILHP